MKIKIGFLSIVAVSMLYADGVFVVPQKKTFNVTTAQGFEDAIDITKNPFIYTDRNNVFYLSPYTLNVSSSSDAKLQLYVSADGSNGDVGLVRGFEKITLDKVDLKGYVINSPQTLHLGGKNIGIGFIGDVNVTNSRLTDVTIFSKKAMFNNAEFDTSVDSVDGTNNINYIYSKYLNINNSTANNTRFVALKADIKDTTLNQSGITVANLVTQGNVKAIDSTIHILNQASGSGIDLEFTKFNIDQDAKMLGMATLPNTADKNYIRPKYKSGITDAVPYTLKLTGKYHTQYMYSMNEMFNGSEVTSDDFTKYTGLYQLMFVGVLFDEDPGKIQVENENITVLPTHKYYQLLKDQGIIDENGSLDSQKLENKVKYANEIIYGDTIERINLSEFFPSGEYQPAHISKNQAAVNIAHTALSQARFAYILEINNLTKRLGEIRGLENKQGVWFRGYVGKGSYKDVQDIDYQSITMGADKYILDNTLLGFSVGYNKQKLSKDIKGVQDTYILTAYGSKFYDNGFYVDGVLKYLYSKGDYENDLLGNVADKKLSSKASNAFLVSGEMGYRFGLNNTFFIEPQTEIITGYIPLNEITSDKVTMKSNSYIPLNIKAGVNTIYRLNDKLDLRVGLGGIVDMNDGKVEYKIEDALTQDSRTGKDSRGYINLFGAYALNDKTRINLELEKTFGGDFSVDYNLNFNLRCQF